MECTYFLHINNPEPEFYIVGQDVSEVTQWEPQIQFWQQKQVLSEVVSKLWSDFLTFLCPSVRLPV